MKSKPSSKLIGIFVTISTILFVGMVMFFGSTTLLSKSEKFILFFDQSVNGLAAGSPVKFRGVPIGEVERIMIRAEGQKKESTSIPVIIRLDRSRLEQHLGISAAAFTADTIHESIDEGLVAQLNLQSFITGQLFVEFSFDLEKVVDWSPQLEEDHGMVEIPTLGSSLDEITSDVAQMISNLSALDFNRMNENVNEVLENLAIVLEGIDSKGISESIVGAADEFKTVVASQEFKDTLNSVNEAFQAVATTAETFNLEDGALSESMAAWTTQFEETMAGLDTLLTETGKIVSPESELMYEFQSSLRELSRAAQSIRILADYLERNPNAILTGRPEDE